jgi:hypothetical protein
MIGGLPHTAGRGADVLHSGRFLDDGNGGDSPTHPRRANGSGGQAGQRLIQGRSRWGSSQAHQADNDKDNTHRLIPRTRTP